LVCGALTSEEKVRFTQVLKGMIAVAVAEFDKETTGAQIDELARQFLKKDDCDYRHGTGHGIGSVMCVHEDGVKFSPKFLKPIVAGAVCSDEPGFYKDGEYGIRIENMLYCKQLSDNKLGFETLTLVPIDLDAIEQNLLTEEEIKWINNYHRNIKQTLKSYLSDNEYLWLENKYYEI
jgi:Xaa-Pro aminopeptidase